jgi:hypothetical protein
MTQRQIPAIADARLPSRRTVLTGVAVSATAIGPATASPNHSALLALEVRAKELSGRIRAHSEAHPKVHSTWLRMVGRHPRRASRFSTVHDVTRLEWRLEQAEERFAARKERMKEPAGVIAHEEKERLLKDERYVIEQAISSTPATDIEGLRIKARMAYGGGFYYPAAQSILEDLLGIQRGGEDD